MKPFDVTEALVRRRFPAEIVKRGEDYRQRGAVEDAVLRGDTLTADVQGSEYDPYRVTILFGRRDIESADCTCPYGEEWDGWCKHIAAVLLSCAADSESIEEAPALGDLLAPLDADALRALILDLARTMPDAIDEIVRLVEVPAKKKGQILIEPNAANAAPAPPASNSLRRGVRGIFRGVDRDDSRSYWQMGAVAGEILGLLGPARRRLEKGDAGGAIAALEAVTDEYARVWFEYDDSNGELGAIFDDIGALWTEAFLTAVDKMTKSERAAWKKKIEHWAKDVGDYGIDEAFDGALEALEHGWDDPNLKRVLRGDVTAASPPPQDDDSRWVRSTPDMNDVRINILDRLGRREEALRLAKWSGKAVRSAELLIALDRLNAVEREAVLLLRSTNEALTVAKMLDEKASGPDDEAARQALRIAAQGLNLSGDSHALALWLRDAALEADDGALARRAAESVVRALPALDDWKRLEQLTVKAEWSALRDSLIADIVGMKDRLWGESQSGAADILLREGRLAEALLITQNASDEVAGRFADAALNELPEEVLVLARKRAEPIMSAGRSGHYEEAARWVARAKTALRLMDRDEEWRTYLAGLLAEHRRRYKLMALLKALE